MASLAVVLLVDAGCSRPQVVRTSSRKPLLGPSVRAGGFRGDRVALAFALGLTRDQDSLTFGEWARAAYRSACPKFGPTDVDFRTYGDSHATQIDIWWKQPTSTYTQPPCGGHPPPDFHVAAVRVRDGAVEDPASGDSHNVNWLARFRQGEPLPSVG